MTCLKDNDASVSGPLHSEYRVLLSDAPDSAQVKLGEQRVDSVDGKSKALTNLVSLHDGEVVELDPRRTEWRLRLKAPGSASAEFLNEQWNCCENREGI